MREIIEVPVLSAAIRNLGAPTSALVRAGDYLFTCGMPPIDLSTGEIIGGSIAVQTRASIAALDALLRFAGSSIADIVKTTVYVTEPALMGEMNTVYREMFGDEWPARTSAAIKPWPAPFDIEIESIAYRPR